MATFMTVVTYFAVSPCCATDGPKSTFQIALAADATGRSCKLCGVAAHDNEQGFYCSLQLLQCVTIH